MIRDLLRALEDIVYLEKFSDSDGILQGIDPRIKVCSLFAFVVVAVSIRTARPLIILFITITLLSVMSKIPLRYFIFRVTSFIPTFVAVIVLPLFFVTPGASLMMTRFDGFSIHVTREGVLRALQFTFRIWLCVASLTLLVLTTRFSKLVQAMERLQLPKIFVMMTAVTYRFIFLFIDEARRMVLAREARMVGKEGRMQVMESLGNIVAALFVRAYERGEMVYLAMQSRCYMGGAKSLGRMKCDCTDWLFVCVSALICLLVLLMDFRI